MRRRRLPGLDDLVVGGIGPSERDIGPHGIVEQDDVLAHHRDGGAQGFERDVADVLPIDQHRAGRDVVEARHQRQQRRFAGSGAADEGGRPARLGDEIHVVQGGLVGVVGEFHVGEMDFTA